MASTQPWANDPRARMALAASVVKIEALSESGSDRIGLGSGVVVGEGKVVTNCHVTRRATSVTVVRGAVRHEASREASDFARDLCLLDVPGLALPAVPMAADDALQPGHALLAVGYTGGAGVQFSAGDVVALHAHDGARVIQSSNRFTSGASGGALFDAQGRLVGVLTFRLRASSAVHYYSAPVSWVSELLRASPLRFRPVAPRAGLSYWEQPQGVGFLEEAARAFSPQD